MCRTRAAGALGSSSRGQQGVVRQVAVVVVVDAMGRVRLCEWTGAVRIAVAEGAPSI